MIFQIVLYSGDFEALDFLSSFSCIARSHLVAFV